jgi:hypothetical protein
LIASGDPLASITTSTPRPPVSPRPTRGAVRGQVEAEGRGGTHLLRVLEPLARRPDADDLARTDNDENRDDRLANRTVPSTATDSPRRISAMSTACSAVTRPHPPPMNVSGVSSFGSLINFTPGLIQIASDHPPRSPSFAL